MSGSELIRYIAKELEAKGTRCYDSAIIRRLNVMTEVDLAKLISKKL